MIVVGSWLVVAGRRRNSTVETFGYAPDPRVESPTLRISP